MNRYHQMIQESPYIQSRAADMLRRLQAREVRQKPPEPSTVPLGSLKRGRLFSTLPPGESVAILRVLSQGKGTTDVQPTNTRNQTPFVMLASARVYPVEEKARREEP